MPLQLLCMLCHVQLTCGCSRSTILTQRLEQVRNVVRPQVCLIEPDMAGAASVNLANKTFVITGGNSGIGLETARALVNKNAHVVIASRSRERGDAAVQQLKRDGLNGANVDCMQLDMASFR